MAKKLAIHIQSYLIHKKEQVRNLWMHDWLCYAFARKENYQWFIDPESKILYRQHSNNVVGASSGVKSLIYRASIILSGDGFKRVISQAEFLELNSLIPIKLLKKNSFSSLIRLAMMAPQCKRKYSEKIFFSIALILMATKQLLRLK